MTTRQHLPAGLDALAPGPELGVALGGIDPAHLVGADAVTYMRACFRQHNHTGAVLLEAVREAGLVEDAETVRRSPGLDDWSAYEASAALGWSTGYARGRMELADDLARRLPAVAAAHRAGWLDEPKVRALAEWTSEVPADLAREVARVLLPDAPAITVGRLVQRIQQLLRALDPEWAQRREDAAVGRRRVSASRNPSGSAELAGQDLPLERVVTSTARITRLAERAKQAGAEIGLALSVVTLRADVFLGLLDGAYHGLEDDTIVTELVALHRPGPGDGDDASGSPDGPGPDGPGPDGPGPDGPGPDGPGPPEHLIPDGPGCFREPGTLRRLSARECVELRLRLSTLLGLDEHPAEVAGWGSIGPELARRTLDAAAHAEWRIAITDDAGQLLHVALARRRPRSDSRHPPPRHPMSVAVVEIQVPLSIVRALDADAHTRYGGLVAEVVRAAAGPFVAGATSAAAARRRFPTAALTRWVQVRDRHCVGPACTRPARRCDLDHTLDHALGGPTSARNLGCLCRRCHRLKHAGGWHLEQRSEGWFRWTARSGTAHDVRRRRVPESLPEPVPTGAAPSLRRPAREDSTSASPWPGWDDELPPRAPPPPRASAHSEPDF